MGRRSTVTEESKVQTALSRYEVRLADLHRKMGHLKEAAWVVAGVIIELEPRQGPHIDPIGRWAVRVIDRASGGRPRGR
jgi:hypothetical protein